MSRIVTALYDTRAEAETARARLQAEANAQNTRILAKDTVAAVDDLKIATSDTVKYRDELHRGGHLVVAEVPDGKDPQRIITLLEQSMLTEPGATAVRGRAADAGVSPARTVDEARIPRVKEELRIGKRSVERGGAHVRSFVREKPAEEQVPLRQERVAVETRSAERRLSDADVESAGLLKERVIEVSEMREEPVVTKSAFVREEVILKKEVTERVETIRDTLRHTEVEVEELPGTRPGASGLRNAHPEQERGRT